MSLQEEFRLVIVVEGVNDVQFLYAISGVLNRDQPELPNLDELEKQGLLLFVPAGGSNLKDWAKTVAILKKKEFHLFDREEEPQTSERQKIVQLVNRRAGRKRALENYLHPAAIREACGIDLSFDDDSDVPNVLARALLAKSGGVCWTALPQRGQRRLREKAKKLLNGRAVAGMTVELLREQDSEQEVVGWLRTIQQLLSS